MTFVSRTQFHVERPWGQRPFSIVSFNSVLNVKALVGAFNQEKALVGAFLVIVKLLMIYSRRFVRSSSTDSVSSRNKTPHIETT